MIKEKTITGLLIEDDPEDVLLLMELLAKPGWSSFKFAFTCAENLRTGLKLLGEEDFEVILLDLMLPDSSGIETVSKARAAAPDIPIVVMTGLSDEAMGLEALAHGAQDYQVKGGIDGHALKRTISFAVERHRLASSLKSALESAPDGMLVVDSKGIVHYANAAAQSLFGRSLPGQPFPQPLPEGGRGEMRIAKEDGAERVAELRLSSIQWNDQRARLVSMRDITDLRRLEQLKAEITERRRVDKLKDDLMSSISHEMRSPLTIIKAASCTLREGLAGPLERQQTKMVEISHRNILRLEKIIDNVLNLARLESGRAVIKCQRVDALELIKEVAAGFDLVAGERKLVIERDLPRDLPGVSADPELFVEVLNNLLANAVRFARERILLRARLTDSPPPKAPSGNAGLLVLAPSRCVQFSVIDDGKGIPRNRIPDLFNRFVQADRGNKVGGYGGTGLGLALCKEIVDRQSGRIWVESEEGRGADFHFTLPCHEEK